MIVVRKSQIQELERKRKRSNMNMLLSGVLIGAALGAIVALLLAPNDGTQTRGKITNSAKSLSTRCRSLLSMKCCSDSCCDEDCCTEDDEATF